MVRERKQAILVLSGILIVAGAVGYATYRVYTNNQPPSALEDALFGNPELVRYIGMQGEEVSLESYTNQILYINSWASWSPLSRDELIALNEIAGEYQNRGITFIALNRKETKDVAERFLSTMPPLPHLTIVIDTTDNFYGQVGGYAMPETLVYDSEGALVTHERQPLTKDAMKTLVESLLTAQ